MCGIEVNDPTISPFSSHDAQNECGIHLTCLPRCLSPRAALTQFSSTSLAPKRIKYPSSSPVPSYFHSNWCIHRSRYAFACLARPGSSFVWPAHLHHSTTTALGLLRRGFFDFAHDHLVLATPAAIVAIIPSPWDLHQSGSPLPWPSCRTSPASH
jgi:hypothetical protein